ncbi:MAG: polysaccharide deacetylase family protein [Planctomycetota bacterium]
MTDAILTFHSVDDSDSLLSYAPEEFEVLVSGLLSEGVQIVSVDQILQPATSAHHRVALTFDDGIRSIRESALPILERAGVPAIVYVVSHWVGRNNRWPSQPPSAPEMELMSWAELREIHDRGIDIGAHGASHADLRQLAPAELDGELIDCRNRIEEEVQAPVHHFAYPYGAWTRESMRRVSRIYRTAVTGRMRFLRASEPPHRLPRIDTYYMRRARAHLPMFGHGNRTYLWVRAVLRRVRRGFCD